MNSEKLSPRLNQVAEYIINFQKLPIRLADIGSDHAYLPCYLGLNDHLQFAIAGEVVDGPFHSAEKEVRQQGLNNLISVRKGDGLAVVEKEDQINTISICGMGGVLIRDILAAGRELILPETVLVLQPNMAGYQLREWLNHQRIEIVKETVIDDHHRQYEIIVAIQRDYPIDPLGEYALLFGEENIKTKSESFIKKWNRELDTQAKVYQTIIESTDDQHPKALELATYIKQIREVLK